MTQSNTSSPPPPGGWKYLLSSIGVMAVEVHQNEKISDGGKDGGRRGVGSAIRRRRAIKGSIPYILVLPPGLD